MKVKIGFLVTPLGEKNSKERIHADRMKTEVFKPLETELNCRFERADTDSQNSVVAETIFQGIVNADIIIADAIGNNPNVLYEIGIAHAINKPVVIINPDGNLVPFDIRHLTQIQYSQEIFNSSEENAAVKAELREKIKKAILQNSKDVFSYEKYVPAMISRILTEINDLADRVTMSRNNSRIVADYIEGEDEAFKALTDSVRTARKSIRTTRFSPHTVVNRQYDFFQTIKEVMNSKTPPQSFSRIIAVNHEEKYTEIENLVRSNLGRDFTIYMSRAAYSFEIVIVDEETVFIHFRKSDAKNTEQERNIERGSLISATLKFANSLVAREFVQIFESIVANNIYVIRCAEINNGNFSEKISVIESKFKEELKRFLQE
jgi:nucleoside 2-deoxyribosyltransferase